MKRWSKALMTGTALWIGWRLLKNFSARPPRRADLSENLSRWEGEGGNVPDVPEVEPTDAASSARRDLVQQH